MIRSKDIIFILLHLGLNVFSEKADASPKKHKIQIMHPYEGVIPEGWFGLSDLYNYESEIFNYSDDQVTPTA